MRTRSAVCASLAALALAGCAHASTVTAVSSPLPAALGRVGYVRMDDLVKRHPLYGQLARYDADIQALSLRSVDPQMPKPGADLAREDAALRAELKTAAQRTDRLLKAKQNDYAKRENAAIAAALRAQGAASAAPGSGSIATSINTTAAGQRTKAAQQTQSDLESYRQTLIRQDRAAIGGASQNLSERAMRTYRARADELQAKESSLSLELANKDSAERLTLRTRLSNLALDDAGREEARTALQAIDRREADEVAAMRNRDQQTLATLQAQLDVSVRKEVADEAARIHNQSLVKLRARENGARLAFGRSGAAASQTVIVGGKGAPLPADLRAKIAALHKEYQAQFDRDAKTTIADFNRTRSDLQKRFNTLHSVDANAQAGAQKQMASLQHERDDLYAQMVAQINREVRSVAQSHGITVVLSGIVAPANGVDLTADAQKEIESLHE